MPLEEYRPGTAFPGVIGRTFDQSSPAWPQPLRAQEGMANVLFIILDDTGFGQLGCYGSRFAPPTWITWPRVGWSTTTCTPLRCARPVGRAC